ncbi:hypothetical protein P9112_009060 [Eukaryota sp. TZLM1-RC]
MSLFQEIGSRRSRGSSLFASRLNSTPSPEPNFSPESTKKNTSDWLGADTESEGEDVASLSSSPSLSLFNEPTSSADKPNHISSDLGSKRTTPKSTFSLDKPIEKKLPDHKPSLQVHQPKPSKQANPKTNEIFDGESDRESRRHSDSKQISGNKRTKEIPRIEELRPPTPNPSLPPNLVEELSSLCTTISSAVKEIQRLQATFSFKVDEAQSTQITEKQRLLSIKENDLDSKQRELVLDRNSLLRERNSLNLLLENSNKLSENLIAELNECRKLSEDQSSMIFERLDRIELTSRDSVNVLQSERSEMQKTRKELLQAIEVSNRREHEYRQLINDYSESQSNLIKERAELDALRSTINSEREQLAKTRAEIANERQTLDEDIKRMTEISLQVKQKSEEVKEEQDRLGRDYGHCEQLVNELRESRKLQEDKESELENKRAELIEEEKKINQLRRELKSEMDVLEQQRSKLTKTMEDYDVINSETRRPRSDEAHFGQSSFKKKSFGLNVSKLEQLKKEALSQMNQDSAAISKQRSYLQSLSESSRSSGRFSSGSKSAQNQDVRRSQSISADLTTLHPFSTDSFIK